MNVERFEHLLSLVGPLLKKREMYTALSPSQRLTTTLWFLAAGESQGTLSFSYPCGQSTVSKILAETSRELVIVLKSVFVKPPANEMEWRKALDFGQNDAHYNLIIDVGAEDSQSDGGVFPSSEMGRRLNNGSLYLPHSSYLPQTETDVPYFLVGDAAFPLKPFLMKPYGQRNIPHDKSVYNFRLSRTRRVIENAFGYFSSSP